MVHDRRCVWRGEFCGPGGFWVDWRDEARHSATVRFHQGGTVIKFRCLNCGQKLAVSEDGIGAVVSCTNCTERIVVPPYSITEFLRVEPTRLHSAPIAGGLELIRPEKGHVEVAPTSLRAALVPQLARLMMN